MCTAILLAGTRWGWAVTRAALNIARSGFYHIRHMLRTEYETGNTREAGLVDAGAVHDY